MDCYEVQVSITTNDNRYYVEHRFAMLPALDTMVLLLKEAQTAFFMLYGGGHEYCSLCVVHLDTIDEVVSAPVPQQHT